LNISSTHLPFNGLQAWLALDPTGNDPAGCSAR
jgi:hypothetical protein